MADMSLWLPLGTAAIGAAAALAGNALGPLFGARGEHQQWLRNKRAQLLEDFHAVLDEAEHDTYAYGTLGFVGTEPVDHVTQEAHSREIFERLQNASARGELYVSRELADLMSRCTYDYHVVYSSSDFYEPQEWNQVRLSWVSDVDSCKALIRRELKVD